MGLDISDIIEAEPKALEDFRGKALAVDAYNALYQFLAIIRQPDGTPLKDRTGRVTSHLSGLFYRTSNMVEAGIKPIYVFDGEAHPLKRGTIDGRIRVRQRAEQEWEAAKAAGDVATARMKAMQSSYLTGTMVKQARELLVRMGIPWVQAPADGEAQAAFMASRGDAWAVASQDYDSLLFGAPRLVKNLTISGRRKLPRRDIYVDVQLELVELEENLARLGLTRQQLVDLCVLIGTDFNEGIRGVGPKKALALVRKHGNLETILRAEPLTLEGWEEVRQIFLDPNVTEDYTVEWRGADEEAVKDLLCREFDFSPDRVGAALVKMRAGEAERQQRSLDQFF